MKTNARSKCPDTSRRSLPATPRLGSSGPSSLSHQKEYVREIRDAKKPETREKRIASMMDALRQNQRKK
jgi:uncharacterized protein YdeI (YjbR/CyaY-like superfamily)